MAGLIFIIALCAVIAMRSSKAAFLVIGIALCLGLIYIFGLMGVLLIMVIAGIVYFCSHA